jgi:hypothetical protein
MSAEPHPDVHWPAGWSPAHCDRFVSHERTLRPPADAIFARLVTVGEWPAWQRGVPRAELLDEIVVGGRILVVDTPHTLDGIVGELVVPSRFGWAAVSDELSFYQSWLLLNQPGGGTRAIFQEAARGPSALLRRADRAAVTGEWLDALAGAS